MWWKGVLGICYYSKINRLNFSHRFLFCYQVNVNVLSPHTKNRGSSFSLAFLLSGCMHDTYTLHLEPNLGVLRNTF